MVDYKERLVKLRLDEESSSEDENVDSEEEIKIVDEDSEDMNSDDEGMEALQSRHNGILVIKTTEEEEVVEAPAKEGEAEAKEAEDKEEGNEKKKKTFKYYRCYMPQWRHKVKKKRLVWETSIEVKPAAASMKAAEPVMAAPDDFGETPMG